MRDLINLIESRQDPRDSLDDLIRWGDENGVSASVVERADGIELDRIDRAEDAPKGQGAEFIRRLASYADHCGKPIYGTVTGWNASLEEYYTGLGFEVHEHDRDQETGDVLIVRNPSRDVDLWESVGGGGVFRPGAFDFTRYQWFYIRFGEVPTGGKSKIGPAYRTSSRTHEAGLSVFETRWNAGLGRWEILIESDSGLASLDGLLDQKRTAYLVVGDELEDTGTDGEPLLENVDVLCRVDYHFLYVPAWGKDPLPEEYLEHDMT